MSRPTKTIKTETTRIRHDVLADARMVAALRRIDLSNYLSDSLAPLVARDLQAEKRKLLREEQRQSA